MKARLSIFAIICGISLLVLSACGPGGTIREAVVPYKDSAFTVKPFMIHTITVNIRSGAIIEGYLTVRGGNDDVRFYIDDSYGNRVLDINRVQGRYDFSYAATSDGFHTMNFDNSFSWITSKQVFLHYRVR